MNTDSRYHYAHRVDSIDEMIEYALRKCPQKTAYKYKKNGEILSCTYKEFVDRIYALGAFVTSKGVYSTRIACIGQNSFNWINAYFMTLRSNSAFVPLDKDLPAKDIIHIINDSESTVLFCSKKYESLIEENPEGFSNIKLFISLDREEDEGRFVSIETAIRYGSSMSKAVYLSRRKDVNEMKLLVYTSGTTGMSKGVMLSEKNVISCCCGALMTSDVFDVGISILPYNHTYEGVVDLVVSFHNHSTLCLNDSLKAVLNNFKLYQPEYTFVVPAIAEIFYSRINREIEKKGQTKKFQQGLKLSKSLRRIGIDRRRTIFADILETFGGKFKLMVCGGAPIRPEVAEFFDDIGIIFLNGYGITECSPLVCVNNSKFNDPRTAGIRIPGTQWRIDNPNSEGIGEICVKGDSVMIGYYNDPEQTAEVLKDGWFYTGDFGIINDKDQLVICGRKKNIIVLNNGKNIYPEEIEGYIQNIDYVAEVVVSGEKDEKGNETVLKAEVFLTEKKTEDELLRDIKSACAELPAYKQISKVKIRDKEFEKTTTKKIKRKGASSKTKSIKEKAKDSQKVAKAKEEVKSIKNKAVESAKERSADYKTRKEEKQHRKNEK